MGGGSAPRSSEQGGGSIFWVVEHASAGGVNRGFYQDGKPMPW